MSIADTLTNLFGTKSVYTYKDSPKVYDRPQVQSGLENQNGKVVPIYTDAPNPRPVKTIQPKVSPTPTSTGIDFGAFLNGILGLLQPKKPTQTPTPSPIPTPAHPPIPGSGFHITVPTDQGDREIPQNIAQMLGNELDQYKLATQAAQVLLHPKQQTYTPQEIVNFGHENWNIGENPRFITHDVPGQAINTQQANGTWDMGLMRDNSGTFQMLQGSHRWNTELKNAGLTNVSQLSDPVNSIKFAKILGDYNESLGVPRWVSWFAAPLSFRTGNVGQ